jgi:hypothetical protein
MLEVLMKRPERCGVAQLEPMRAAGHDRIAMEDAVAVGAMFACILRVADSLGFEYPNSVTQEMAARYLLGNGYGPSPGELVGARRYAKLWADLQRAVEMTSGHSKPELRRQVFVWIERDARTADAELDELPSQLHTLLLKGSRTAYQITDQDIAELLRHGWDEGAVFEIVVALATSAGATRYAIAMEAIDALASC